MKNKGVFWNPSHAKRMQLPTSLKVVTIKFRNKTVTLLWDLTKMQKRRYKTKLKLRQYLPKDGEQVTQILSMKSRNEIKKRRDCFFNFDEISGPEERK